MNIFMPDYTFKSLFNFNKKFYQFSQTGENFIQR